MPPPPSIIFGEKEITLFTYDQLARLGKNGLKTRAMNLRDVVGADRLPRLSPAAADDSIILWLLQAQCTVASASGQQLSLADLGVPKGAFDDVLASRPASARPHGSLPPHVDPTMYQEGLSQPSPHGGLVGIGQGMAPHSRAMVPPARSIDRTFTSAQNGEYRATAPPATPSGMRPDQESDNQAAANRRRAQGSSIF